MRALVALVLLAQLATAGSAQDTMDRLPNNLRGLKFDQRLGNALPMDARFRDETGAEIQLGDTFKGRPAVVALVYYECPMLCSMLLNGAIASLKMVTLTPGEDFEVVVVSFDHDETPALAAQAKDTAIARFGRPETAAGWHFLTGDEAEIARLADAIGFSFRFDPESGEFAHPAGIVVATPDGKAARYLYGIEFPSRDLRLALVEASAGKIGNAVDQVMLFCFRYDPTIGKYSAVVLNIVRAGGILTAVALIVGILLMSRWDKNRSGKTRLRTV